MTRKKPEDLRSHRWLGVADMRSFGHRSRLRQIGYDADDWTGQAGDRHHQHLERDQSVPRASALARRQRQARRVAGRRLPDRTSGDLAVGDLREAVHHAVSQFAGDGDRGAAAQPSARRRGADGRLRQDHAGPGHGRDQHGHSGDLHSGRPDAARQLERPISSARAPTSGNTGPRSAPATSPTTNGTRSRAASPARSAPAW